MEQLRFVERDPRDKKYKIGRNAFYVGSGFIAGGKREKVLKAMANLVHELKHTITLGVLVLLCHENRGDHCAARNSLESG